MLSLDKLAEFIAGRGRRVSRVYVSPTLTFIETTHSQTMDVVYVTAPRLSFDVSRLNPIALHEKPSCQIETATVDTTAINYGIDASIVDTYADIVARDKTAQVLGAQVYRLAQGTRTRHKALGICGTSANYFAYSDGMSVHVYYTQDLPRAGDSRVFYPAVHVNGIVDGFALAGDYHHKLKARMRANTGTYFSTLQRFVAGMDGHIAALARLEKQCAKHDATLKSLAAALADARQNLASAESRLQRAKDAAQRSIVVSLVDEARRTAADIESKTQAHDAATRAAYASLERAVFENNLLIETVMSNV